MTKVTSNSVQLTSQKTDCNVISGYLILLTKLQSDSKAEVAEHFKF